MARKPLEKMSEEELKRLEELQFDPEPNKFPPLKLFKMHPDVPDVSFGTQQSACFDLRFSTAGKDSIFYYVPHRSIPTTTPVGNSGVLYLKPRFRYLLPTGLKMQIPAGYSVRIHPRSGLALKQGLTLVNCEGVIDSDYIQEVFLTIINLSDYDINIANGDRLCQAEMIVHNKYDIEYIDFEPVQVSDRTGGLGSTGVK
jgi:dUTP pyrophosphatase